MTPEQQTQIADELAHENTNHVNNLLQDRGAKYGNFKNHAKITQQLKAMMMQGPSFRNLTTSQWEALEMIAHKIGRIVNGDPSYVDSWDDIAGYATLIAEELRGVTNE